MLKKSANEKGAVQRWVNAAVCLLNVKKVEICVLGVYINRIAKA